MLAVLQDALSTHPLHEFTVEDKWIRKVTVEWHGLPSVGVFSGKDYELFKKAAWFDDEWWRDNTEVVFVNSLYIRIRILLTKSKQRYSVIMELRPLTSAPLRYHWLPKDARLQIPPIIASAEPTL